jgi:hypothetical protein
MNSTYLTEHLVNIFHGHILSFAVVASFTVGFQVFLYGKCIGNLIMYLSPIEVYNLINAV